MNKRSKKKVTAKPVKVEKTAKQNGSGKVKKTKKK